MDKEVMSMKKQYMEPEMAMLQYEQEEAITLSITDDAVNEDELEW